MKIDIPEEELSEEVILEIEETLQTQLGEELGIHPELIDVSLNPETGEVIYTIRTDDVSDAEQIQSLLETKSDEITAAINDEFENNPELANIAIKWKKFKLMTILLWILTSLLMVAKVLLFWKKLIILLLKTNMKD